MTLVQDLHSKYFLYNNFADGTKFNKAAFERDYGSDIELKQLFDMHHDLFEGNVFIKEFFEILDMPGFYDYKQWLRSGGNKNGKVDAVIARINKWKESMTGGNVHSIKDTLDEAVYVAYAAMTALHEKISSDVNLKGYFFYIFPSNIFEEYKKVFDDPRNAIVRKRFIDEIECSEERNTSVAKLLTRLKETTPDP